MIDKVIVRNFRTLRALDVELSDGLNIVVGNNDTGKSTLIEAIGLALTGRLHGRALAQELTPYLINMDATREYIDLLHAGKPSAPPEVLIEVYLRDIPNAEVLRGSNNFLNVDACGVRLRASLSDDFAEEYANFIATPADVRLVPTEYYRVEWFGFSGGAVTSRSVPVAVSLIDPSAIRGYGNVDHHLQDIISTHLGPKERVELSRQYRNLREEFAERDSVKQVNLNLQGGSEELTDRSLTLGMDISQRHTWESSLVAHLNEIPFPYVGKGEQSAVKTLLAITQKADKAHVVLIEEPENHLSFSSLRNLIGRIEQHCDGRQVVIATHNAYVLNKLGLDRLLLLGEGGCLRLSDLPPDTVGYFKKLAGYDTLRLVLARATILVEGPSDELVVQRAYRDAHGHDAIEDGIDIISVGLSHKRFLDIAVHLGRRVAVVRDNDGDAIARAALFVEYVGKPGVAIHVGVDDNLRTLEPQVAAVNDLATMNAMFGRSFDTKPELVEWMIDNKATAALAIFETDDAITMPSYIADAVAH